MGDLVVEVARLEDLDAALRAAPWTGRGVEVGPDLATVLDGSVEHLHRVLKALGFAPVERLAPGAPSLWRRRRQPAPAVPPALPSASPFSALAALRAQPPAKAGRRPPRRRRKPAP